MSPIVRLVLNSFHRMLGTEVLGPIAKFFSHASAVPIVTPNVPCLPCGLGPQLFVFHLPKLVVEMSDSQHSLTCFHNRSCRKLCYLHRHLSIVQLCI